VGLPSFQYLSICSGNGGLDLGVRLALETTKCCCYVENEAFAIEVLAQRMEEGSLDPAPIWSDLRTFDGKPWRGKIQGIIGGYPCQPWSLAGKRLGKEDPRHLWPSISRIIREIEPSYCFFENVEGHISLGLPEVRAELRAMGFRVEAGLFSAAEMGGSHIRKRLFIFAAHERVLADTTGEVGRGELEEVLPKRRRAGLAGEGKVLAVATGMRGSPDKRLQQDGVLPDLGQNHQGDADAGVPVFPPKPHEIEEWKRLLLKKPELEPALCELADESANRVVEPLKVSRISQLRLLGNSVVPTCAAVALSILLLRLNLRNQEEQYAADC